MKNQTLLGKAIEVVSGITLARSDVTLEEVRAAATGIEGVKNVRHSAFSALLGNVVVTMNQSDRYVYVRGNRDEGYQLESGQCAGCEAPVWTEADGIPTAKLSIPAQDASGVDISKRLTAALRVAACKAREPRCNCACDRPSVRD